MEETFLSIQTCSSFETKRLVRSNRFLMTFNNKKISYVKSDFDDVYYLVSYILGLNHRVISDRVHRLLVTLPCFRPDRFVQLLSLIPILILLLYLLVSISLNRSRAY